MKRAFLLLIVTVGFLSISSAGAASIKRGFYIGAQGGVGGMETPKASKKTDAYGKDDLQSWIVRGYLGHLWGQGKLKNGVEFGYAQYADNEYENSNQGGKDTFKYKGHYFDLSYVLKVAVVSGFNIFGKAGVAYTYQATKATESSYTQYEADKTRWWPKLAAGFGYEFTNGVALDLTYDRSFGRKPARISSEASKEDINRVASVSSLMLGVSYHF